MTREEKQKAIDALKISAPVMAVTQEEFENYIQTLNKIMDWLEQEPTGSNNLSSGTRKNSKKLESISTTKENLAVDAVSRAEVLKLMQDNWHTHNGDWAMQESMDDIRALPAVTPQEPRWISVSERLPEDRREVLVTAYWHETYQVMMASYYGDGLWWCVPFNNCGEHMQRLKPKAWMPLPKAYKEVEE